MSTIPEVLAFREQQKMRPLHIEIASLKTTVEVKDKEIFFLSSQIVSLREQYSQKILMLESTISEDRKELAQLRLRYSKMNSLQSDSIQKEMLELKRRYDEKLEAERQHFERLVSGLRQKFENQLLLTSEKYETLIAIEKKEVSSTKQIMQENNQQYNALIAKYRTQNDKLKLDKGQLNEQIQAYRNAVESLKQEFKKFTSETQKGEIERKLEVSNQILIIKQKQDKIKDLEKQLQFLENDHQMKLLEMNSETKKFHQEAEHYRTVIKKKDQEIVKLSRTSEKRPSPKKININHIKECQHEGLIRQLESSVVLLTRENAGLKKQLNHWSSQIGFDEPVENRLRDLSEISDNATNAYKNLKQHLKRRTIGKK